MPGGGYESKYGFIVAVPISILLIMMPVHIYYIGPKVGKLQVEIVNHIRNNYSLNERNTIIDLDLNTNIYWLGKPVGFQGGHMMNLYFKKVKINDKILSLMMERITIFENLIFWTTSGMEFLFGLGLFTNFILMRRKYTKNQIFIACLVTIPIILHGFLTILCYIFRIPSWPEFL